MTAAPRRRCSECRAGVAAPEGKAGARMWICKNLDRPVIIREYCNFRLFTPQRFDGGGRPGGDLPLLAFRLYARYQDMDIDAMAVLAESWFLSDEDCMRRLRENAVRRFGALGQMADFAREAAGFAGKPPISRGESRKIGFLTDVSGRRYESSLITMGNTHTRACADAVKIFARHLAETEDPAVLAVASGIVEDGFGNWTTDLCRPGPDRNCTVMDMDGTYPFENGRRSIVYSL